MPDVQTHGPNTIAANKRSQSSLLPQKSLTRREDRTLLHLCEYVRESHFERAQRMVDTRTAKGKLLPRYSKRQRPRTSCCSQLPLCRVVVLLSSPHAPLTLR